MQDNLPFGAFSKYNELGNDLKNGMYLVQIIQNGSVYTQIVMLGQRLLSIHFKVKNV